jgi:methionine sulfoxide reductase heme-binding subunit
MLEAGRTSPMRRLMRSFMSADTVRRAIYILGAIPAVWLFYAGFTDQLGADPVRALEKQLGILALRFLIIGLAITPLWRIGGPNLVRYRRAIGLLAFFYASLHLFTYLWFDQNMNLSAIGRDILKRPYVTVGFAAFLILVPLAITSNNAMIKQLGSRWNLLHKGVYLAVPLAAAHFIMLVKRWPPEPLIYASIVALLLGFRLVVALRKRAQRSNSGVPASR